jgi:hypothetical protein
MSTASKGPLIVYGQRPPLGTGTTGSENPYLGPSMFYAGSPGLIDSRAGYNNTIAGCVGFVGSDIMVLDATPATKAANNIAASQSPGSGAITLVSTTGAGVTVMSASQYMPASGVTIPSGTLALDGQVAFINYGRALNSNSGRTDISAYDPSSMLSRTLQLVSGGNDSGITFTVKGWDVYGFPMTETITGANAGTATGAKAWKYIASVTQSGAVASTLTIGTNDVIGFPIQVLRFGRAEIFYNNALITANTGFTAAVTTSPATATTGDVRGTYALQSAADGTKTIQIAVYIPAANLNTVNGAASVYGVTQF